MAASVDWVSFKGSPSRDLRFLPQSSESSWYKAGSEWVWVFGWTLKSDARVGGLLFRGYRGPVASLKGYI